MAATEITREQWKGVGFKDPSRGAECPTCPVDFIDFFEAIAYANELSAREGYELCYDLSTCGPRSEIGEGCPSELDHCAAPVYGIDGPYSYNTYICTGQIHRFPNFYECPGYRLPTTAEWEFAARAGTTTNTYNGDVLAEDEYDGICRKEEPLEDIAWYCWNSSNVLHPVGEKRPNAWGLYDMLGNAFEWVDYHSLGQSLDAADGKFGAELLVDPTGPKGSASGTAYQIRGGSVGGGLVGCNTTATSQVDGGGNTRFPNSNFRLVRTLFDKPK